jgi:hypothetical protein
MQPAPVIRQHPKKPVRALAPMKRGLVRYWSKQPPSRQIKRLFEPQFLVRQLDRLQQELKEHIRHQIYCADIADAAESYILS